MSKRDSILERGGPLYDLLADRFPTFRSQRGYLDVPGLADAIEVSGETMYRVVRGSVQKGFPDGWLTPRSAELILELSAKESPPGKRLYAEDLLQFVIPHYRKHANPMRLLD